MAAQRFRGPVLPDGEARDLYVVDGAGHLRAPGRGRDGGRGLDRARSGRRALPRRARRRTAPSTTRPPRSRRSPTATPARCCCATAARRRTPRWIHDREDLPRLIRAGRHLARTKRYIRNYAHEVEPDELAAYVAQEAQRGDGWVKLVGDWIERDSGDLAPVLPGRRLRRGDRGRPRARRQGHRPLLRRGGAARPDRGGHRLHRARHRAVRRPDRRDGRAGHRAGPDRAAAEQLPGLRRRRRARSSRRTPSTCSTCTPVAARRSWPPTRPGWRSTPAPTPAACCRTATSPARCSSWPTTGSRPRTRSARRPGGPAPGSGSTGCSRRAPRPTSSSTTATRSRT